MKYIIHNKLAIQPESQQAFFEEEVRKKVKRLEKILQNYPKELILEVFVKGEAGQPDSWEYEISVSLKGKPLVLTGKGRKPMLLVNVLLDKLRYQVKLQLAQERKQYLNKRKRRQADMINQQVDRLAGHKKENNKQAFMDLLADSLPAIRRYIRRSLKIAHATGLVKNKAISPEELVDEVYLRIFDQFNAKPDIAGHLLPWMYQEADEVLAEQLQEIDFEREQVTDLDKLVRAEIEGLEENYTADAGADLIMMDELDDPSYRSPYYPAGTILQEEAQEHIQVEDEQNQMEIPDHLDEEKAHQVISTTLAGLPAVQRSVFDLYWLEGLDPAEISFTKRISVQEVERILNDTRRLIAEQLTSPLKV